MLQQFMLGLRRQVFTMILAAVAVAASAHPATAVIVRNQQANNTAPTGDQGFSYVGRFGTNSGANSGVYLGYVNGYNWALTAFHNYSSEAFYVGGQPLNQVVGGSQQIGGGTTDLRLVKLGGGSIGLGPLAIRSATITSGTAVTMVGYGVAAAGGEQDFTPIPAQLLGYDWTATGTRPKLWGTNNVANVGSPITAGGHTTQKTFSTEFNRTAATEATFADKDSGSGVFIQNSGVWELAGIAIAIGQVDTKPVSSRTQFNGTFFTNSVYGDYSYMADLSYYRNDIIAAMVPEPASMALMGLAAAGLISRRRRS